MTMTHTLVVRDVLDEAKRQYDICNACRYCEGYCPVWEAMSLRTIIKRRDVLYFALLCYDHKDCYYACPYISPHYFALNIPSINRQVRLRTYNETIPKPLSQHKTLTLVLLSIPIILSWVYFALIHSELTYPIDFYRLVPYPILIIAGFMTLVFSISILTYQSVKYISMTFNEGLWQFLRRRASALLPTLLDLLAHRWFYPLHIPPDRESRIRFYAHVLIFYGFLLDVVSTVLGAIYQDILGIQPPFPIISPVVITGTVGGVMLIIGATISIAKSPSKVGTEEVRLSIMVLLVALTGMLVLTMRFFPLIPPLIFYGTLLTHLDLVYILFTYAPLTTTISHVILRPITLLNYNYEIMKLK